MGRVAAGVPLAPASRVACRLSIVLVCLLVSACSDEQSSLDSETAATEAPDTGTAPPPAVIDTADQEALREASTAFAADLAELQTVGSTSLGVGGDLAGFYQSFADASREASERYGALQVPAEADTVRSRLVTLLDEQATVLETIASGAATGEDDSLTPQLERLTELLGDVSTTNAELLRSMGVDAPDLGA